MTKNQKCKSVKEWQNQNSKFIQKLGFCGSIFSHKITTATAYSWSKGNFFRHNVFRIASMDFLWNKALFWTSNLKKIPFKITLQNYWKSENGLLKLLPLKKFTIKIFHLKAVGKKWTCPLGIENPYEGVGRNRHEEVRQRMALKVVEIKLGLTTTLFKEGDRW